MLYQLPITGDWIDPKAIWSVRYAAAITDSRTYRGDYIPPRVLVDAGPYDDQRRPVICALLGCESEEQALEIRDEIAAAVNAARADKEK